jgi:hypothetical protein
MQIRFCSLAPLKALLLEAVPSTSQSINLRAASLTVGHVERNPVVRPQAPVPNYWIHRKGSYERAPLVAFAILNSRYTFT